MKKINCWEFKQCERQPGGERVRDLGTCPVTINEDLDGTHGGIGAGRVCWAVAGSFCGGKMEGTFAQKLNDCGKCDFMALVKREEELAPPTFKTGRREIEKARNRSVSVRTDPGLLF